MSQLTHLNPTGLPDSPAFSQAVEIAPGAAIVFIGGQNGVDDSGNVVSDNAYDQTIQALENVQTAVEAAGGSVGDIAKWTITATDRDHIGLGFEAFLAFWDQSVPPPAISMQIVIGLAHPDFLVEIEAVAGIVR